MQEKHTRSHIKGTGEATTAPVSDLSAFIIAEVQKQTSEDALRKVVETKIGECVRHAVDNAMRSYGDVGKQIEKCVANSLQIGDRLDVPAYGAMVMALLRAKLDETVSDLVGKRIDAEMTELLSIAPKETKFSDVVRKMIEAEDKHDRYYDHVTCVIDESEYTAGSYFVGLDRQSKTKRYECETQFHVSAEGVVSSLSINRKDIKTTISTGPYYGYQKMIFAVYACGTKLIMDDLDPPTNIGED